MRFLQAYFDTMSRLVGSLDLVQEGRPILNVGIRLVRTEPYHQGIIKDRYCIEKLYDVYSYCRDKDLDGSKCCRF